MGFQAEKKLVRELFESLEHCNADNVENIFNNFVSDDFIFKGTETLRLCDIVLVSILLSFRPRNISHVTWASLMSHHHLIISSFE